VLHLVGILFPDIKMGVKETGLEDADWINLAEDGNM